MSLRFTCHVSSWRVLNQSLQVAVATSCWNCCDRKIPTQPYTTSVCVCVQLLDLPLIVPRGQMKLFELNWIELNWSIMFVLMVAPQEKPFQLSVTADPVKRWRKAHSEWLKKEMIHSVWGMNVPRTDFDIHCVHNLTWWWWCQKNMQRSHRVARVNLVVP